MAETPPRKTRHYEAVDELVSRTEGDVSSAFVQARAAVEPVLESLMVARPAQPRLVGSAEGSIDRLLLTIPAYAVRPPLAEVYQHLLGQLAPAVEIVALTHESVRDDVSAWMTESGHAAATLVSAPDHLRFSIWAEDGYVAVTDADGHGTYLLEPFSFPRFGDSLIADFVATATDLENTQAPLYFQGGNVLIGDDFFLIGADYPANSLDYVQRIVTPAPGETPAALVRRLFGEYLDSERELLYVGSTIPVPEEQERTFSLDGQEWTELVYLGNAPGTAQPLFHIDMFISLAGRGEDGRYRLLVGDPRQAAEVLQQPGHPHAMVEVFDNVARTLQRRGFDVRRNPLPLVYVDDERSRQRRWYFATSNNALVEDRPDRGPTVYLPTYGYGAWSSLAATDEANRTAWQELGFSTVALGDFHPFAENLGAVHCIKKYLARSTR